MNKQYYNVLIVFSLLFVGDYQYEGFFLYYILLLVHLVISFSLHQISKVSILSFLTLFGLYFDILIREFYHAGDYHKIIYIITSSLWLKNLIHLLKHPLPSKIKTALFSINVIVLVVAFFSIFSDRIRSSLIFGPNVYYRVVFFLWALQIVNMKRSALKHRLGAFLSIISTGSRASLILGFFLLKLKIRRVQSLIIVSVGSIIIYNLISSFSSRLLYYANLTESYRYLTFMEIIDPKLPYSLNQILFGSTSINKVYSFYPHNIFLESFVEHGIIRTIIPVFSYLMFIYNYQKQKRLYMPIAGIFIGALFSGSYYENFIIASLPIFLILNNYYETEHYHNWER